MPALSEEQRVQLLQFVPRVPAALSIVGSGLIMIAVRNRRGAMRKEPYHRMMFCLSSYDLLGGMWTVLGSMPVPAEYGIPGSVGNMGVCSAQGFFIHFSVIATNIYNSGMVVYFLMKVRYNVREDTIAKCFEPAVHISALALSLALALTGVILKVFNPIGFGGPSNSPLCYIQAFPPGCDFVPTMECSRGGNASTVMWYIAIVPFIIALLGMLIPLALVMCTVLKSEKNTKRHTFNPVMSRRRRQSEVLDPERASSEDPPAVAPGHGASTRNTSNMSAIVGKRCLTYGVVFLNTFLWTTISMIVHNKEPPNWDSFWLGCLAFIFMPLQGFLNFIIYISPRYKRLRKENRDKTVRWAMVQSVFGDSRRNSTLTGTSA